MGWDMIILHFKLLQQPWGFMKDLKLEGVQNNVDMS